MDFPKAMVKSMDPRLEGLEKPSGDLLRNIAMLDVSSEDLELEVKKVTGNEAKAADVEGDEALLKELDLNKYLLVYLPNLGKLIEIIKQAYNKLKKEELKSSEAVGPTPEEIAKIIYLVISSYYKETSILKEKFAKLKLLLNLDQANSEAQSVFDLLLKADQFKFEGSSFEQGGIYRTIVNSLKSVKVSPIQQAISTEPILEGYRYSGTLAASSLINEPVTSHSEAASSATSSENPPPTPGFFRRNWRVFAGIFLFAGLLAASFFTLGGAAVALGIAATFTSGSAGAIATTLGIGAGITALCAAVATTIVNVDRIKSWVGKKWNQWFSSGATRPLLASDRSPSDNVEQPGNRLIDKTEEKVKNQKRPYYSSSSNILTAVSPDLRGTPKSLSSAHTARSPSPAFPPSTSAPPFSPSSSATSPRPNAPATLARSASPPTSTVLDTKDRKIGEHKSPTGTVTFPGLLDDSTKFCENQKHLVNSIAQELYAYNREIFLSLTPSAFAEDISAKIFLIAPPDSFKFYKTGIGAWKCVYIDHESDLKEIILTTEDIDLLSREPMYDKDGNTKPYLIEQILKPKLGTQIKRDTNIDAKKIGVFGSDPTKPGSFWFSKKENKENKDPIWQCIQLEENKKTIDLTEEDMKYLNTNLFHHQRLQSVILFPKLKSNAAASNTIMAKLDDQVTFDILNEENLDIRTFIMERWIMVMYRSYELGDIVTVNGILVGLRKFTNLDYTVSGLSPTAKKIWDDMRVFLNPGPTEAARRMHRQNVMHELPMINDVSSYVTIETNMYKTDLEQYNEKTEELEKYKKELEQKKKEKTGTEEDKDEEGISADAEKLHKMEEEVAKAKMPLEMRKRKFGLSPDSKITPEELAKKLLDDIQSPLRSKHLEDQPRQFVPAILKTTNTTVQELRQKKKKLESKDKPLPPSKKTKRYENQLWNKSVIQESAKMYGICYAGKGMPGKQFDVKFTDEESKELKINYYYLMVPAKKGNTNKLYFVNKEDKTMKLIEPADFPAIKDMFFKGEEGFATSAPLSKAGLLFIEDKTNFALLKQTKPVEPASPQRQVVTVTIPPTSSPATH